MPGDGSSGICGWHAGAQNRLSVSNMCSIERSLKRVETLGSLEPDVWHVWVRGHGEHAPTQPGLVLQWQYTPIRNATAAAWSALVLVAPFPEAVLVQWVSADRLVAIKDASPKP